MAKNNSSADLTLQKQSALWRVLKATTSLPAQMTFYGSALGAIALIGGSSLPAGLGMLAAGVGVNALSSILERLAKGDNVSENEIQDKVIAAIEESHIAEKLAARETQVMIAKLFRRHDLLNSALQNHEYFILQRLTEQAQAYESFVAELRDELSTLYVLISAMFAELQASHKQSDSIFEMVRELRDQVANFGFQVPIMPRPGSAPPNPMLIVGRENALKELKTRLGVTTDDKKRSPIQILTAIKGWPGIGKTTIAAALAHDPEIALTFPDGVLWVSLGQTPSLLSELAAWGRALGIEDVFRAKTVEEASAQLTALLLGKQKLLIVDDVWEPEHAIPFRIGGPGCAMLVTTRENRVAQSIAPTPKDIYKLDVLADDKALDLLKELAPEVVVQYPEASFELAHELEGLPLALQVAGHMLNVEASYGFSVVELLNELREATKNYEGRRLLEAQAPADRVDLASGITPTVAVLLKKSTDRLDDLTRDCFAYLGAFAPKPATFDLAAMKAVWQIEDPKPRARSLVDRGLLEYIPAIGRYQMHALIVMHARSLLTDE
ncbi:MAG: NB-ARC domain-containing protein [Chloroflexi bacterium]|nr:NB-ARC domain-containing protein [Chloroflexota bacterium]